MLNLKFWRKLLSLSKLINFKKILIIIFIFGTIGVFLLLFLLYGPINNFRDWLITTSMDTMNHKYLATFFYSDDVIEECLNRNKISEFADETNIDEVQIVDYSKFKEIEYANEYERQILEKDSKNNDYKIITIDGEKYSGYLAVIYDSSRVEVATTKYLGQDGQYLTTISEQNNAFVAINAGGFVDPTGNGTGGLPLGITIHNGSIICEAVAPNENCGLIGLTNSNKLYLGKISSSQAILKGIRDAVSFGPFLIVNGNSAKISGNGGGGLAPRTAIGQRKDGIMLFLVLDGNRAFGEGATYADILDIMEKYGAYNATCLDGGTSTGMTVKHQFINNPSTQSGLYKSRPISTAFILKSDESDDGDYSAVVDKIK
jgi:exopolysaccharide biosynthesis protein